jgi:hypothetical protein
MADKAKTPERSLDRIAAEIDSERSGLVKAFDGLRHDLTEAAESDNRAIAGGRKAALLIPGLAVAVTATVQGMVAGLRGRGAKAKQD